MGSVRRSHRRISRNFLIAEKRNQSPQCRIPLRVSKQMKQTETTVKPVNLRQEKFVMEYLASGNATQSAERAGYTHPNHQAFRLLLNNSVKAAIESKRAELMSDSEAKLASYVASLEAESRDADQSGTRVRALELLIKVVGGFAPEQKEIHSYHGAFLADLDMDEPDLDELLVDNSKDINDLH